MIDFAKDFSTEQSNWYCRALAALSQLPQKHRLYALWGAVSDFYDKYRGSIPSEVETALNALWAALQEGEDGEH